MCIECFSKRSANIDNIFAIGKSEFEIFLSLILRLNKLVLGGILNSL
ncbi:MAG: hypothetical protein ACJAVY_001963 [Marinoscillum sp.]|jgi:hypothetical protein